MPNILISKLSGQILETKICITDTWIHVNEYAYKLQKTEIIGVGEALFSPMLLYISSVLKLCAWHDVSHALQNIVEELKKIF